MTANNTVELEPEHVVVTDDNDRELGSMEKLAAHRDGVLHRAFSVFIFDEHDRLLLQQRATTKYHSAGLWTNTCCGHPRPSESIVAAAERRLHEEMGIITKLKPIFHFTYRTALDNGLVENELDHVLIGRFVYDPEPNANEAADWRWIERSKLELELAETPERFTAWFPLCVANAWDHNAGLMK